MMAKLKFFCFLLNFILALSLCASAVKPNIEVDAMGELLLLDGGRKKPFDTYARETVLQLSGKTSWKDHQTGQKWSALELMTDMAIGTNHWTDESVIKIAYLPLKELIGIDKEKQFFSYGELRSNPESLLKLQEYLQESAGAKKHERIHTEANLLFQKIHLVERLLSPDAFCWVPVTNGGSWVTPEEGMEIYKERAEGLMDTFSSIKKFYRSADQEGFTQNVNDFKMMVAQLVSPSVYPTEKVSYEIIYNHLHPFRLAWILLLVSFLLMLCAKHSAIYWSSIFFFFISILLQITGFILRTFLSGRAPVTNMYEVMVFMALGAVFLAFIYELIYRQRVFIIASSIVGSVALILADNLPAVFDPSIRPLVPVLQSNWWLTIHVITITIGYAAFLLAMGIGHVSMFRYLFRTQDVITLQKLTQFNYRTLQIGVLFLAAGTLLGGLWAEKAWGRFWGWDPKETWALIALLIYLGILHARYISWIKGFGLNAASVLAFQGIIMAGYGVNYLLGTGKHSYGFGIGGEWTVLLFVVVELLLVFLAVFKYRISLKDNGKNSTVH